MPQGQLSQQQLAVVLRRAAELERRRKDATTGSGEPGLTDSELQELVREVGLPQEDVARAVAELRAGVLVKSEPAPTLTDRLVGPAEVARERVVRGDVVTIETRIGEYLRAQELQVKRDFGDRQLWAPTPGFLSKAKRVFFDVVGKQQLPDEIEVETSALAVGDGEVVVRMTVRARELRREKISRMIGSLVVGAGVAAAGIAAASGNAELITVAAGSGVAIAGYASARRGYHRELAEATLALDGFLDGLEHGERRRLPPA
jgi:hypothetical protein